MPTQESNESWIATCTVFGRTNSLSNAEDRCGSAPAARLRSMSVTVVEGDLPSGLASTLRGAGSLAVDMETSGPSVVDGSSAPVPVVYRRVRPRLLRLVGGGRSSWPRRVPDAVFTLPASQDPLLCVSPEIGKSCRHIYLVDIYIRPDACSIALYRQRFREMTGPLVAHQR
jgi:hypothetical protein